MPEGDAIKIREGVEKTIKKWGDVAGGSPKLGQLCYVHYTGTLADGTVFDSSHNPGRRCLQLNVGQGQVILGWDLTVATMLKGEKCVVKIAPEYAYGNSGSPPVIPPNATLTFEIELLEFCDDDRTGMSNIVFLLLCAFGIAGIIWSIGLMDLLK